MATDTHKRVKYSNPVSIDELEANWQNLGVKTDYDTEIVTEIWLDPNGLKVTLFADTVGKVRIGIVKYLNFEKLTKDT